MHRYSLHVHFHAENDEDATNQTARALEAFDDGFERAVVRAGTPEHPGPIRLVRNYINSEISFESDKGGANG